MDRLARHIRPKPKHEPIRGLRTAENLPDDLSGGYPLACPSMPLRGLRKKPRVVESLRNVWLPMA